MSESKEWRAHPVGASMTGLQRLNSGCKAKQSDDALVLCPYHTRLADQIRPPGNGYGYGTAAYVEPGYGYDGPAAYVEPSYGYGPGPYFERDRGRHLDLTPDQGIGMPQLDANGGDLVEAVGCGVLPDWTHHAANLAGWVFQFQGTS